MSLGHGASVVRSGLVLYLDAASVKSYPGSGTTWSDISGNNKIGTLTNGPTFDSANNGSIVFDGTNDYVDLGASYYIATGVPFTVSLWFKNNFRTAGVGEPFHRLISLGTSGSYALGIAYVNILSSGYKGFYITAYGGWPKGSSHTLISQNIWSTLTLTYNGSTSTDINNFTMYLNNDPVTWVTSGLGNTIATNGTYIAVRQPSDIQTYSGTMGVVQVYNRVLSESERLQNLNAFRGRYGI